MKLHIKKFQKVGKISIPIYETKSALDFLTSKAHLNYNHRSRVRVTFPAPKNPRSTERGFFTYTLFTFHYIINLPNNL